MPRPPITKADILADFLRVEKICPGFTWAQYSKYGCHSPVSAMTHFGSFNAAKQAAGLQVNCRGRHKAERKAITPQNGRFIKPEPEEDLSWMRRCLNGGEQFYSPDRRAVQNCDKHRRVGEEIVYYGLAR